MLSTLQGISPDYYEAARIDGANPLQELLHVTLPDLRQILLIPSSFLFIWIASFRLTSFRYTTMNVAIMSVIRLP